MLQNWLRPDPADTDLRVQVELLKSSVEALSKTLESLQTSNNIAPSNEIEDDNRHEMQRELISEVRGVSSFDVEHIFKSFPDAASLSDLITSSPESVNACIVPGNLKTLEHIMSHVLKRPDSHHFQELLVGDPRNCFAKAYLEYANSCPDWQNQRVIPDFVQYSRNNIINLFRYLRLAAYFVVAVPSKNQNPTMFCLGRLGAGKAEHVVLLESLTHVCEMISIAEFRHRFPEAQTIETELQTQLALQGKTTGALQSKPVKIQITKNIKFTTLKPPPGKQAPVIDQILYSAFKECEKMEQSSFRDQALLAIRDAQTAVNNIHIDRARRARDLKKFELDGDAKPFVPKMNLRGIGVTMPKEPFDLHGEARISSQDLVKLRASSKIAFSDTSTIAGGCASQIIKKLGIKYKNIPTFTTREAREFTKDTGIGVFICVSDSKYEIYQVTEASRSGALSIVFIVNPDLTHTSSGWLCHTPLNAINACRYYQPTPSGLIRRGVSLRGKAFDNYARKQGLVKDSDKWKQAFDEWKINPKMRAVANTDRALGRIDSFADRRDVRERDSIKALRKEISQVKSALSGARENGFAADNFNANNFGARTYLKPMPPVMYSSGNLPQQLLEDNSVPLSSFREVTEFVRAYASDDAPLHPKDPCFGADTMVMRIQSQKSVDLSAMPAGHTISIVTPETASYKGALVLAVDPSNPLAPPIVLDYVAQDRDPENFSSSLLVLGSRMSIAAPLVVGGTTTVVGQMSAQMAKTYVPGYAGYPGKMAPIAVGRNAPQFIMGAESHHLLDLPADKPFMSRLKRTSQNRLNADVMAVPNAVDQLERGIVRGRNNNAFTIACGRPASSGAATAAGFLINASVGNVITTTTELWRWSQSTDYMSKMLYGDVEMQLQVDTQNADDATSTDFQVIFFYSDGTQSQSQWIANKGSSLRTESLYMNTLGNCPSEAQRGLLVTDIMIQISTTNSTTVHFNNMSICFLEVPADEMYLSAVITSAIPAAKILVNVRTDVEIRVDPFTATGSLISSTNDLPYLSEHYQNFLRLMHLQVNTEYAHDFHASSFGKWLKKTGRYLWNHGGKDVIDTGLRKGADKLIGKIAGAKGFGEGAKPTLKKFVGFPAIYEDGSASAGAIFHVCKGVGAHPKFLGAVTDQPLTSTPAGAFGSSSDLAFLLSALKISGWPVKAGILVSGEVDDVEYFGTEITFTVKPVRYDVEKLSVMNGRGMIASPYGFLKGDSLSTPVPSWFFGPSVVGEITKEMVAVEPHSELATALESDGHRADKVVYWHFVISRKN